MFLMKNNHERVFVGYIHKEIDTLSGSHIIDLKKGDTVWIMMQQAGRILIGTLHSTWSGMLL